MLFNQNITYTAVLPGCAVILSAFPLLSNCGGKQVVAEQVCAGRQTQCGSVCADLQSDPSHCGNCDRPCDVAGGQVCLNGTCRADCGSLTNCSGSCVDLSTNPEHCGDCDWPCDTDSGQVCLNGICRTDCGNLTDCEGSCVDIQTDPQFCGGCHVEACTVPDGTAGCEAGSCTVAGCDTGYAHCDTDVDNGCETPTDADPENCGDCNRQCGANVVCVAGDCGQVGVTCAGALCPGAEQCCWEVGVGEYCFDPGTETCGGSEENCDGPEDCPPGDICCHDWGGGNFAECMQMNQCGSGLIFCAEDDDCQPTPTRPYCCPMVDYFAICSDNPSC
jgi:hypothetical protein